MPLCGVDCVTTARPSLTEALQRAERIHDRAHIEQAVARMSREIVAELDAEVPYFLPIMNGALIFAGALALAMPIDLEFDYVHATRYRGQTQGRSLHWIKPPPTGLAGRTVLLVDDILDEGHTLQAIRDFCLAHGARRVLIAVLCQKQHGRVVPGLTADFVGVEVPDRYVFGFGMDYYEQGRNLPAIYAL